MRLNDKVAFITGGTAGIGAVMARRFAGQSPFAGFREVLAPAVIQVAVNTITATQLSDRAFATQPFQHNADLFF
jgi:short-subunit dehydrogenase involved in D-alanine esterification of teichoic acids